MTRQKVRKHADLDPFGMTRIGLVFRKLWGLQA
jgi:hypothetical protein